MKKYLALVLTVVLCCSFAGCGKSESVKKVERKINAIGTVTAESNEKITAAEEALNKLKITEKIFVGKKGELKKARKEFEKLVVKNAEENIDIVLNHKISLNSDADIKFAEKAVKLVPKELTDKIKNLDKYKNAKEEFDNIVIKEAEKKISEIGEVTTEKESIIKEARRVSNLMINTSNLSEIKNIGILNDAENTLETLKEEERIAKFNEVISRTRKRYDDVQEVTRYEPLAMPYYANTRSYVLPLIANKTLAIRWLYTGDDWIFWDNLIIKVDGEKINKSFDDYINRPERDHGGGDVWEIAHTIIFLKTSDDYKLLEKIAKSSETIVRFQGDNKNYDLYVSETDKNAIKDMLFLYDNRDLLDN